MKLDIVIKNIDKLNVKNANIFVMKYNIYLKRGSFKYI